MSPLGLHIGTLVKPHGVRGEMIVRGNPMVLDKLTEGMPLFIVIDGQRVPFFIEEVTSDLSGDRAIVKLEFINSVEDTRRYMGCLVYADDRMKQDAPGQFSLESLVGYSIVDRHSGKTGKVTDFVENRANPLLILEVEGEEVMLPALADYIITVDTREEKIVVAFPEGLV